MTITAPDLNHAPEGFLSWVAALVHQHRRVLIGYARKRGLDAEDALDAVQDSFFSFLHLPEARTIARDGEDAIKLLTVVLRHNVMNRRRTQRRRSAAVVPLTTSDATDEQSSERLLASAEELARAHGCILRMAELQRRVVMLSLLDELPAQTVAEELGIQPGYVRVLLHRAREHVRSCPYEPEPQ